MDEEEGGGGEGGAFDLQVSYTVRGCPMATGAQEVNDRGRASTSFCRRQSRIIDSRGTLTSKDPYEHCATVIPIF